MGNDKINTKLFVILDSNALLQIYRGVSIFDQIEETLDISPVYICPDAVLNELKKISEKEGEISRAAKLAIEYANNACVPYITGEKSGDRAILKASIELSSEGKTVIVSTSDRKLRSRLRSMGIKTAYYRETQHRFEVEARDVL
ncbi:MAG: hypothetical protein QW039_00880 [Fervidicoccaceae archaeon]